MFGWQTTTESTMRWMIASLRVRARLADLVRSGGGVVGNLDSRARDSRCRRDVGNK